MTMHMVAARSPGERAPQSDPIEVALIDEDELVRLVVLADEHLEGSAFILVSFNGRLCDLHLD